MDVDAGYRGYVRDLMESQGFTVFEASHPDEALRLALEKRPWLILTDVNMPNAEGFEFCRSVRGHSLISHTPLIFLSSWDGYRERYHALKLGADDYVSKSATSRELLVRIQLILKRYSDLGTRTRRGAGMEGQIELVGAPGALQMCHLGLLTGVFTVRRGTRLLEIGFRNGEIISAESGRIRGAEAVYDFLSWTSGHFEFIPRDPGEGEPLGTFEKLLLEGCRLMDEALREETERPSAGRSPVVPFRTPLS
jgi:CheY-like chemotaxis protein